MKERKSRETTSEMDQKNGKVLERKLAGTGLNVHNGTAGTRETASTAVMAEVVLMRKQTVGGIN